MRRTPGLLSGQLLKLEIASDQLCVAADCSAVIDRVPPHCCQKRWRSREAELAGGNENQRVPFEIAAIHMARGEHEAAFDGLDKAVAGGLRRLLDAGAPSDF